MAQQTETQSYDVIEKHDKIEIRFYPPAAKVMSKGKINGNSNFRNLFNYISGSNSKNEKISMTTPVYMKNDKENQIMEFVLPKKFNNKEIPSRQQVIENLVPYIKDEIKKGTRLNQIMRHTLGLFHGQSGASYWKRYLSQNMCVRDADVQKIDHIMDKIKFNNIESRVG